MKILVNITNQEEAEKFLTWVQYRGDILLGDMHEVKSFLRDDGFEPAYVYVTDATEIGSGWLYKDPAPSKIKNSKPGPY